MTIRDCGVTWLPGLARNDREECGVNNRTEAVQFRGSDAVQIYTWTTDLFSAYFKKTLNSFPTYRRARVTLDHLDLGK